MAHISAAEKELINLVRRVQELSQDENLDEQFFEQVLDTIPAGEAEIGLEALVHALIEWDKKLPADMVDRLLAEVETDNPDKPHTLGLRDKLVQKR